MEGDTQRTEFAYIWTNKKTNRYYAGSHKGDPDDGYIASNKDFLARYERNPQDWNRTVVLSKDCRKLEEAFLKAVNASQDYRSFNRVNRAIAPMDDIRGEDHFFYGKKRPKHSKWMKENHHKYWKGRRRKDIEGNNFAGKRVRHIKSGEEFKSITEAAKQFGYSRGTVSLHVNGHIQKKKFEFVNEEQGDK